MTYIKSFRVEGLAGRAEPVEHTLDRYTNIFWGLNGTGKTTVLQLLDAAMRNDTRSIDSLPFKQATVIFHAEMISRDVKRTYVKGERHAEFKEQPLQFDLHREVSFGSEWATEDDDDDDDPGWTTTILGESLDPSELGDIDRYMDLTYARRFLPISRVVTAGRTNNSHRTSESNFVRLVNEVWRRYSNASLAQIELVQRQGLALILAILFGGTSNLLQIESDPINGEEAIDADEAFHLVSSFLRGQRLYLPLGLEDFVRRYEESEQNKQVVARIRNTNSMVDEIRAPERELQTVIEEMYVGNKHLEFEPVGPRGKSVSVSIGEDKIPLTSLSSGEKQLLQMLLETLAAASSPVIIDEPELSLHPDWQKRLVGSMRRVNSRAQFVLATHSPDLMLHVPLKCVFEL